MTDSVTNSVPSRLTGFLLLILAMALLDGALFELKGLSSIAYTSFAILALSAGFLRLRPSQAICFLPCTLIFSLALLRHSVASPSLNSEDITADLLFILKIFLTPTIILFLMQSRLKFDHHVASVDAQIGGRVVLILATILSLLLLDILFDFGIHANHLGREYDYAKTFFKEGNALAFVVFSLVYLVLFLKDVGFKLRLTAFLLGLYIALAIDSRLGILALFSIFGFRLLIDLYDKHRSHTVLFAGLISCVVALGVALALQSITVESDVAQIRAVEVILGDSFDDRWAGSGENFLSALSATRTDRLASAIEVLRFNLADFGDYLLFFFAGAGKDLESLYVESDIFDMLFWIGPFGLTVWVITMAGVAASCGTASWQGWLFIFCVLIFAGTTGHVFTSWLSLLVMPVVYFLLLKSPAHAHAR